MMDAFLMLTQLNEWNNTSEATNYSMARIGSALQCLIKPELCIPR